MNLIIHQMMQLQHVDIANCDLVIEGLACPAVNQGHLTRGLQTSIAKHGINVFFAGTVKHRCAHRHAFAQVTGKLVNFTIFQRRDLFGVLCRIIDAFEPILDLARTIVLTDAFQHLRHLPAKTMRGPPQMGFQNLPNVHPRGHAQRVQNDVHRSPIFQIRHVFHWVNL